MAKNHYLHMQHYFWFTVAFYKRSQYYSKRPSQEEIARFRRIPKPNNVISTTTVSSDDTDQELDQYLIVVKIRENFWNMLKQLSSKKTHENEEEKYVTNTMKHKYFRVAWHVNTQLNLLLNLLILSVFWRIEYPWTQL